MAVQSVKPYFGKYYFLWSLIFTVAILLVRCYEHFALLNRLPGSAGAGGFFVGLLNDACFAMVSSLLLFLPAYLLWKLKPLAGFIFFLITAFVILVIQIALVKYFLTTRNLLGLDFFAYSMTDIKTTVNTSSGFHASDLIPLLPIILLLMCLIMAWRKRMILPRNIAIGLLVFSVISLFIVNRFTGGSSVLNKNLSLNKTGFFVYDNFLSTTYHGKTIAFTGYPFMHPSKPVSELTKFFKTDSAKPDIVILLLEGLGRDFMGDGALYGGFTPFLDSLSKESLYWSNCFSTSGRSFEVLPSVLGSLPYGKNGFNEMGSKMPDHLSMIKILKNNGYRSSFYYGGYANFDFKDIFLENQGVDLIQDQTNFGTTYSEKFAWGYPDGAVFMKSLSSIAKHADQPQVSVYFTLSTHEPFAVPMRENYEAEVKTRIQSYVPGKRKRYEPYLDVFTSLAYLDKSLAAYFTEFKKMPRYKNTIFIISGDHRLIPVEETNQLTRFHVPLLIYSPMLVQKQQFKGFVSHLDITPELTSMLHEGFGIKIPSAVHWLGKGLAFSDNNPGFELAIMRNKNQLADYIAADHLLSGNDVFEIGTDMRLKSVNDNHLKNQLQEKLDSFRQLNNYVSYSNKLFPADKNWESRTATGTDFTSQDDSLFNKLHINVKTSDSLFFIARDYASANKYANAQLVCRKILSRSPNYHDARILYGRCFAWSKKYPEAIGAFREVVKRQDNYEDAYVAWSDAEKWSGKNDSALTVLNLGLAKLPSSTVLKLVKAKLLIQSGQKQKALILLRDVLKKDPANAEAKSLYASIPE